jgi:hypothetical protein
VGAPRTVIAQAMEQLKQAVDKLPVD